MQRNGNSRRSMICLTVRGKRMCLSARASDCAAHETRTEDEGRVTCLQRERNRGARFTSAAPLTPEEGAVSIDDEVMNNTVIVRNGVSTIRH
jgi:hypothetical protein